MVLEEIGGSISFRPNGCGDDCKPVVPAEASPVEACGKGASTAAMGGCIVELG